MDLRKMYDDVVELQEDLKRKIAMEALADYTIPTVHGPLINYRQVKALAASYELQEYLANRIAIAVEAGELDSED